MATTPQTPRTHPDFGKSGPADSRPSGRVARWRIGRVVAVSLATGLLAAVLLAAASFIRARESEMTGAVLCGFAVGWAVLAILSVRLTDQPQRWAIAPAVFMGAGGLLLVVFGSAVDGPLSWVWPPALLALAIWMSIRVRRQLHSRSRGWLVYPVLAVLALASIGGGYQTLGAAADARAFPMPGQLVDVGGYRLHLNCTGSGSPTVVLQPGAGEMSSNHGWIAAAVANNTRVCAYDRAGRGWSEPADNAQDATQIAADLHALLHRGNVPGPYVLAGHSFGGLYTLTFAARYPDEVAAMVLIDSTDRAAADNPGVVAAPGSYDALGRLSALISTSARLGLGRVYAPLEVGSLPARSRDEVRANIASPANLRSTIDEYVQANTSMQEAASLRDFGSKPLVVLTAGVGNSNKHQDAQDELAGLSTNSVHQTIDWASHEALVADQAGAAITTQAILDVVASLRSGGPLVL
ncbi:pimeloyl-ACP methyl ester carboxylesterase [Pseudarthrobacter siccitolerans]|uniref:Pimeloyl-ACP methyl ester carboxylesterase n=1 Tax=Pseudarthrobacter siccitolerans TaxID=861266 RepID=A0ABU0PQ19_9MICC|nr:alpha/beta hydrolase [Pseudarthrobacter siccitolerans]MDQ0676058.1 pimeloyl-ACP methyl ester carboxylesterase [Pseudarthrobacter siccitolerans]